MDKKLVTTVIDRLIAGNSDKAVEKILREQKELTEVLSDIVEMSKQLREKDALDTAIERKRKILNEVEADIETRALQGQDNLKTILGKIETARNRLNEAKEACAREIKKAEYHKNDVLAKSALEMENKVKEHQAVEKDAFAGAQKARQECDEMESKSKAMKEELIAKL